MIPATAHFIWLGSSFPWVYGLAARSAAQRGGFCRVVLHHEQPLEQTPGYQLALASDAVEARPLEPEALFLPLPRGKQLFELYRRLTQPAARSNMLRCAILYREGGVYLDTDTVTVADYGPLLAVGAFCGRESIALPGTLYGRRHPGPWMRAGALLAARELCRILPRGYRAFRRIEGLYTAAVNNAVLAAAPEHPLIAAMLDGMLALSPSQQLVRFALGTHLLQRKVAEYSGDDLEIHEPALFFPLGPEISQHWFRHQRRVRVEELLHERTVTVHWYASVRTSKLVPRIDARYVAENAERQPFSALALPFV
jgi:hypothetical protein